MRKKIIANPNKHWSYICAKHIGPMYGELKKSLGSLFLKWVSKEDKQWK